MAVEAEQLQLTEAVAPAGTYRLLSKIPGEKVLFRVNLVLGNTHTRRFVNASDSDKPNHLDVWVVVKDGRGSFPKNKYTFTIDRDERVTNIGGERTTGLREKPELLSPSFEDILTEIIETHRHQRKLKSS